MDELHSILATHHPKNRLKKKRAEAHDSGKPVPTVSEIPDLFFDDILVKHRLSRVEIMVLMYIYRHVWCRPNLYKEFGIGQVLSYVEMAKNLGLEMEELYHALRGLEKLNFIETIRPGQFFIRKYFSEEKDQEFGQNYQDF